MKHTVLIVILFCVAVGCSTSGPDDPDLEAWTQEVRVLEPGQIGDREHCEQSLQTGLPN